MNGHKFQSEDTNHAWLCLDLLEVLCQLAERGHASSVRAILKDPLDNCPKVLLLGMAHVNVLILETNCDYYCAVSRNHSINTSDT